MKTHLALTAIALLSIHTHAGDWKPKGEGWVSLFNGKDLSGWKTPAGEHNWQVIDGVIDYEAKDRGTPD